MSFMHNNWARLYKGDGERRQGGTPAERAAEVAIATLGIPYRVQHPLFLWYGKHAPYFPDFFFPTVGMGAVLEIDDWGHRAPDKARKDRLRTAILQQHGYRVVRLSNEEVLADAFEAVNRSMAELGLAVRTSRKRAKDGYKLSSAWGRGDDGGLPGGQGPEVVGRQDGDQG